MRKYLSRLLAFLLLLPSVPASAWDIGQATIVGPWRPSNCTSGLQTGTTHDLNSVNSRFGSSFVSKDGKTVSGARLYISSETGSTVAEDIEFELFATDATTGYPTGAALASDGSFSIVPAGSTWGAFSGMSYVTTAGVQYWASIKNVNGTPASNYISIYYNRRFESVGGAQGQGRYQAVATSSNAWSSGNSTVAQGTSGIRIVYSDGSEQGVVPETVYSNDSAHRIYASREQGIIFTTPANVKFNVIGIVYCGGLAGTPTGNVRAAMYSSGATPTRITNYSYDVDKDLISSGDGPTPLFFDAIETLEPSTVYRAVMSETTQSDTSSNGYNYVAIQIENAAAVRASISLDAYKTASTDGGTNFTETNTIVPNMGLILDPVTPYASNGGTIIIGEE